MDTCTAVSFGIVPRLVDSVLNLAFVQDDPNQSPKPWKEEDSKYKFPGGKGGITEAVLRETGMEVKFFEWGSLIHSIISKDHRKNFYVLRYCGGEIKHGGGVQRAKWISFGEISRMLEREEFLPDHEDALRKFLKEFEKFLQGRYSDLEKIFERLYV